MILSNTKQNRLNRNNNQPILDKHIQANQTMRRVLWGEMCVTRTQPFEMKSFFCSQQNLTVFLAKSFFFQRQQDFVAQNKETMNVLLQYTGLL